MQNIKFKWLNTSIRNSIFVLFLYRINFQIDNRRTFRNKNQEKANLLIV